MHEIIEKNILENSFGDEAEVWPLLKYHMTRQVTLSKGVEDLGYKSRYKPVLFLAFLVSFINLFFTRFYTRSTAYFGAYSRVSINKGSICDEFVPEEKNKQRYTFYHCANFEGIKVRTCFTRMIIFENLVVKSICFFIKTFDSQKVRIVISDGFYDLISSEYSVSRDHVDAILLDYKYKKVAYKWLLNWLNVKNVEVVSAYTKPAIISAANDLGLATLEYQHGLLAPYHPSYYYSGTQIWPSSLLPTRLKLYSNFWQSNMENANFVKKDAIEVEGALPKISDEDKEEVYGLVGGRQFLIFTGQGICYSEIARFIIDVLNRFPDYIMVYRPHPREHKNHAQLSAKINDERFKVIDRECFQNTLALIGAAKAHFSIYSSCHFEALELLGRTYVLDVVDSNIMAKGAGDENIIFVKSAYQILDF